MKFVVSGGGTGGHVYPGLAIIRGLQEKWADSQFLYIGSQRGIEKEIVTRQNIPFQGVEIDHGLNRSHLIKSLFTACHSVPKSFLEARHLIRNFKPDAVIGTGGYVSFPVVYAGESLKYPTFIHEQNACPGLTNRLLAKKATCTMLTFPEAKDHLKTKAFVVTGLPVRPEILEAKKDKAQEILQLDSDLFTILVFGGSLGAASINSAMEDVVQEYIEKPLQILWITGVKHYEKIRDNLTRKGFLKKEYSLKIRLYPYLYGMEHAMAASDLAICRCGAATLSELQIIGLPAILIPYPYASENHQEKNGISLAQKGAAVLIRDQDLNGELLKQAIEEIWNDPNKQQNMKKQMKTLAITDSLQKIVAEIERGMIHKRRN